MSLDESSNDRDVPLIIPIIGTLILGIIFSAVFVYTDFNILPSPDEFEASEAVEIHVDNEVVEVQSQMPDRNDEIHVLADGQRILWDGSNEIAVERDSYNQITIETHPGDEGVYDTLVYNIGEVTTELDRPVDILESQANTYLLETNTDEVEDIEWLVDDELVAFDSEAIEYTFDQSGEYDMTVRYTSGVVTYEYTEQIDVFEPDEVVLEYNISSTDVEEFEIIDLTVTEETNNDVQEVDIDWGDGESETVSIGETAQYWYEDEGEYTIDVVGEATEIDGIGTLEIPVTVSEAEEDSDNIHNLTVNVQSESGDSLSDAVVNVSGTEYDVDGSGTLDIEVNTGEYEITANADEHISDTTTTFIDDDMQIDMILDEEDVDDPLVDPGDQESPSLIDQDLDFDPTDVDPDDAPEPQDLSNDLIQERFDNLQGLGTEDEPYLISDYLDLQAVRGDTNAYYEIVDDIDASLSLEQDPIDSVDNASVGTASDTTFELPYTTEIPDDPTIMVADTTVDDDQYQLFTDGVDPISENPRVFLQFTDEDNNIQQPENVIADVSSDADVTASYDLSETVSRGFEPIDAQGGSLEINARGHTINNLYINRPLEDNVGLFGNADNVRINSLGISARISGGENVGVLGGHVDTADLETIYIGSVVTGEENVGGLIGSGVEIEGDNVHSYSNVGGTQSIGGIAGELTDGTIPSTISESSVQSTNIRGSERVGGIVGQLNQSDIVDSYVTSSVRGDMDSVGMLAGETSSGSSLETSYTVYQDEDNVGGIAGVSNGSVNNVYMDSRFPSSTLSGDDVGTVVQFEDLVGDSAPDVLSGFDFGTVWTENENDTPSLVREDLSGELTLSVFSDVDISSVTVTDSEGSVVGEDTDINNTIYGETYELDAGIYEITVETEDEETTETIRLIGNTNVTVNV